MGDIAMVDLIIYMLIGVATGLVIALPIIYFIASIMFKGFR